MISCPKCGKENQDHYKFCLGCGNELPRDGGAQRPFRPTPPAVPIAGGSPRGSSASSAGVAPPAPYGAPPAAPVVSAAPFAAPPQSPPAPFAAPPVVAPPVVAPPVVAPPAAPPVVASPAAPTSAASAASFPSVCPQCASPNPRGNRFCITCGFDMSTASAPSPAPPAPVVAPPAPIAQPSSPGVPVVQPPPVVAPPVVAPVAPPTPRAVERGRLVLIRPDGSEGATFTLHDGDNLVGRDAGGVFANDMYLSPRHATFALAGQTITVRDEGSLNGIYIRIERQTPVELQNGDVFRIGQEILRYDAFPAVTRQADGTERLGAEIEGLVGKVSLVTGRDTVGNAFPLPVTGIYLGRERGDILFPEDGYVSGLHCQISVTGGKITLVDVGSSNGTYVRARGPRTVRHGDFLLLGQQLFRIQLGA